MVFLIGPAPDRSGSGQPLLGATVRPWHCGDLGGFWQRGRNAQPSSTAGLASVAFSERSSMGHQSAFAGAGHQCSLSPKRKNYAFAHEQGSTKSVGVSWTTATTYCGNGPR